jgi:hypothetical protein
MRLFDYVPNFLEINKHIVHPISAQRRRVRAVYTVLGKLAPYFFFSTTNPIDSSYSKYVLSNR